METEGFRKLKNDNAIFVLDCDDGSPEGIVEMHVDDTLMGEKVV